MATKCANSDCERLSYDGLLCGMCQRSEIDRKELATEQAQRYYSTIWDMHREGKSDEEIARFLQMRPVTVSSIIGFVGPGKPFPWPTDETARIRQEGSEIPVGAMDKTICAGCERAIPTSAYRVVLMAAEMGPEGRGRSFSKSYCESCIAEAPVLELLNVWKLRIDLNAQDALISSPHSEDAFYRSVTGRRVEDNEDDDEGGDGEEALNRADKESVEFSGWVGQGQATVRDEAPPIAVRTVESIRREALVNLRKDRKLWGQVKPTAQKAVTLSLSGKGQNEIARELCVDQGTVSRMIKGALKIAGVAI